MSVLFRPGKIGTLELRNRFIQSATYEGLAKISGEVTEPLLKRYQRLAKGQIGLIIPGYLYVHPLGKAMKFQTGIHSDEMIPGLKKIVDAIHQEGGKIAFQLAHAGRQTKKALIGRNPIGPSSTGRDPVNFVKPDAMSQNQIQEVITAFGKAAKRVVETGADGIQLHAAHGYLINQFFSPFYNQRTDQWGGSDENRFRLLKEILLTIKKEVPDNFPILIKLNTNDYTPKEGVTPLLANKYSKWLVDLRVDAIEVSCGSTIYSFMNMCRGDVPVTEITNGLPWWMRSFGKLSLNRLVDKYNHEEGYNLDAAKTIKPNLGQVALCLVGGLRKKEMMEMIINNGHVDFISMSRPFIREPLIVKKMIEGKANTVSCKSCNKCLAAAAIDIPVKCYNKGFPKK